MAEVPLTPEQKEAVQSGKEHWLTLVNVSWKAVVTVILTFFTVTLALDLSIWAMVDSSLTASWIIAAGIASFFLAFLAVTLFYISPPRNRIAFGLILILFIASGRFWYELVTRFLSIL